MKVGYAEVVENERLYGDTFVTWFRAPDLARSAHPGQFLMLRCSDDPAYGDHGVPHADDPLLPRPMSYHRVRIGTEGQEWSILYDVVGRGTSWLAARGKGDRVYCWGPVGVGYKVGRASNNLLLVAGGIGIAPLVWLAEEQVSGGRSVTLVIGARDAADGLLALNRRLGLPRSLKTIGFRRDEIERAAEIVAGVGAYANPRPVSKDDARKILVEASTG